MLSKCYGTIHWSFVRIQGGTSLKKVGLSHLQKSLNASRSWDRNEACQLLSPSCWVIDGHNFIQVSYRQLQQLWAPEYNSPVRSVRCSSLNSDSYNLPMHLFWEVKDDPNDVLRRYWVSRDDKFILELLDSQDNLSKFFLWTYSNLMNRLHVKCL